MQARGVHSYFPYGTVQPQTNSRSQRVAMNDRINQRNKTIQFPPFKIQFKDYCHTQ